MELTQRKRIRLAEKILQQLQLLQGSRYGEVIRRTSHLMENVEQFRRTSDLLAICLGRNWNAAAGQMTDRIVQNLRDLPYYAGEIERMVETSKMKLPAIRDILADLEQAQEEFEEFKYVEDGELLVVTTEAIELDGYYLGEFEIQLHIGRLAEMKRHSEIYRIVALDPHPSACNDSVTHPHVSDEHMCEGDAGAAIEAALTNGRICDFFQLVGAVLTTYNPNSPYVALADWDGRPCYDCGYMMASDDTYWCSSCENDFCSECISCCNRCEESTCRGCLKECTVCGELVCPSCKTTCPDCGRMLCRSCLEESQCPCIEERQENEENQDDSEQDPSTINTETGQPVTAGADQERGPAATQAGIEAA
jgi:hypothetical protein